MGPHWKHQSERLSLHPTLMQGRQGKAPVPHTEPVSAAGKQGALLPWCKAESFPRDVGEEAPTRTSQLWAVHHQLHQVEANQIFARGSTEMKRNTKEVK